MFRILFFLILVFALALGGAWLAERPGTIDIDWSALGLQLSTTTTVAVAVLALGLVAVIILWTLLRGFFRLPLAIRAERDRARRERGLRALADGLIAVGAGDQKNAQRAAREALGNLPGEPAAKLLEAQTAQLSSNREAALKAFRQMTGSQGTKLLGLHGLYEEARRVGDLSAAGQYVAEAVAIAPNVPWAANAEFEFAAASHRWEEALQILDRNLRNGLVSGERYKRLKAVLLTAQAMQMERADPASARTMAADAHNLAPDLIPAATLACRLMVSLGETRRGTRAIETTWKTNPSQELFDAYLEAVPTETPLERYKRVQVLVKQNPRHPESLLALARAALWAGELREARGVLQPLATENASQRVCVTMAELEAASGGDEGTVRAWLARAVNAPRDPVWTADGVISARWEPVSPVTGRIDAFEWKRPVTAHGDEPAVRVVPPATIETLAASARRSAAASTPAASAEAPQAAAPSPAEPSAAARPAAPAPSTAAAAEEPARHAAPIKGSTPSSAEAPAYASESAKHAATQLGARAAAASGNGAAPAAAASPEEPGPAPSAGGRRLPPKPGTTAPAGRPSPSAVSTLRESRKTSTGAGGSGKE